MDRLKESYRVNGIDFSLVRRCGDVCVYWDGDCIWEVFRVKVKKPCVLFGVSYPERECVPSNEDWGVRGWSYGSLVGAERKFRQLCSINH